MSAVRLHMHAVHAWDAVNGVPCREAEIIMPYELMHVAGSGSVPSWLSQSTLAPFVADALQLEHMLRALASTAAWHFSHAGAPRHASCLASLAASYFFRMVCPHLAAALRC